MNKKIIIYTISSLAMGFLTTVYFCRKIMNRKLSEKDKKKEKFQNYFEIMHNWMLKKEKGQTILEFFEDEDFQTIAIYGIGKMGKHLYEELKNSSVVVKYVIDRNTDISFDKLDIYSTDDELPVVDAIIVTATFDYKEIVKELENKVNYPIISLEDVIMGY